MPGGFPGEIGYTIMDPSGTTILNVPFGGFVGGQTGGLCFPITGDVVASMCSDDQCEFSALLSLDLIGNDFADGWEGSTLDVTINGVTNPVNTIVGNGGFGPLPSETFAYPVQCLNIGDAVDIDVVFVDNSGFDDDEIGWSITIPDGFEVSDPMGLLVNEGG